VISNLYGSRQLFRLAALLLLGLAAACDGQQAAKPLPQQLLQGQTMGTTYSVKLVDAPAALDSVRLQSVLDTELQAINQAMSTYIDDSDLSRFNQAASGAWIKVAPSLLTVLAEARHVHELSDGAFDPSIGPLVNLWGFGPDMQLDIPDKAAVQAAMAQMGFDELEQDLEKQALKKPHAMYLDFSAIAKGYAVDRLADLLQESGLANFLVEIGGELRASGVNAQHQPWHIAIEKPDPARRAVHAVLKASGLGMATSGDYRNFYEKDGRRYSHTIDPRTGYPVSHSLVSVTVLAERCMTADALATAFMVMGTEAAYKLAEDEQIAAWFVEYHEGELVDRLTPKMQSYRLH